MIGGLNKWLLSAVLLSGSQAVWAQEQDVDQAPAELTSAEAATASSAPAQADAQNAVPAASEQERPPIIPTQLFAQYNNFNGAKLSPDGSSVALQTRVSGNPVIVIIDAETKQATGRYGLGEKAQIEWFRWAGNQKILVSISFVHDYFGDEMRYTRLYTLDLESGTTAFVGRRTGAVIGDDVIFVAEDGSYALVSMQRTPYDYPSVYRLELKEDGDEDDIQNPKQGIWNWYADEDGVVRMGTGWYRQRLRVYYRKGPDDSLKLIGKIKEGDEDEKFWDISQIVSGSDEGYVLQEGDDGRIGLRLFNYATREVVDTFYEHPEWNLDSAILQDGKPVAAYYTDDRDRVVWFDEKTDKQYKAIGAALAEDEVWVTSRAKDDSRVLIWAGGEADPGAIYIYTPDEKRIDQFAEMRPKLNFRLLAKPKPVEFKTRDDKTMRAYLTLPRGRDPKGLPLILLPHGGPYGVRDKLRYDDDVQLLANRGYAVLQPNFRGSDGYGKEFSDLGKGQIGRKMQDDIDDAMDWAVAEGIADPARVCVVGSSYGGYAAMWAVIRNPERYRCAASWAGVTDWDSMLKYDRRFLSRKGSKSWRARIEGEDGFDLDAVSPLENAARINRPLLIAHGEDDSVVPFSQFKKMTRDAAKAPMPPETLVIEDEGHSFTSSENIRAWYDKLIGFLETHNPAD